MSNLAEMLSAATRLHNAGQRAEAERLYRAILVLDPQQADAWHLLGVLDLQAGRYNSARVQIERAIELRPNFAVAYNSLGSTWMALGQIPAAITAFHRSVELDGQQLTARRNLAQALSRCGDHRGAAEAWGTLAALQPEDETLQLNYGQQLLLAGDFVTAQRVFQRVAERTPTSFAAQFGLGNALLMQQLYPAAIVALRRAVEIRPDADHALQQLGTAHTRAGDLTAAQECYQRSVTLKPSVSGYHFNLAFVQHTLGQLAAAEGGYQQAIELNPQFAEPHYRLGVIRYDQWKHDEALELWTRAIALKPDFADAYSLLGRHHWSRGQFDEATAYQRQALTAQPNCLPALINLGCSLTALGLIDEALVTFRRALELDPDDQGARQSLLYALQYQPEVTSQLLLDEHREAGRRLLQQTPPVERPQPYSHGTRLRLGFVSPDLGQHPVGQLLVRGFEHLAQQDAALYCYSDRSHADALTRRFQAASQSWHDVKDWSHARLAEQIRADEIDILFDLAGHSGYVATNRLGLFALQPAPVQVTWLGYEGTTGLSAIDYILGDARVIPHGSEAHYSERVVRLPSSYVCYEPPSVAPAVASLPALSQPEVTFGCFNSPAKLNARVIALWSQILTRVPNSRLLLKYRGLLNSSTQTRLLEQFAQHGISAERVVCEDRSPLVEYLASYGRIDIALDPFPFCGGVTTCDALWMGVPVLTCPGETFAGRHSLSFLTSVGLSEWVARDAEDYVARAVEASRDLATLARLRSELRPRMAASPLCDGLGFAAEFHALCRDLIKA